MGDRGEVQVGDVYLYTHWDADRLPEIVKAAMVRGRKVWDDGEYLARVIFCEMIKDEVMGLSGNGISTQPFDAWRRIYINTDERSIIIRDNGKFVINMSFEDYVTKSDISRGGQ